MPRSPNRVYGLAGSFALQDLEFDISAGSAAILAVRLTLTGVRPNISLVATPPLVEAESHYKGLRRSRKEFISGPRDRELKTHRKADGEAAENVRAWLAYTAYTADLGKPQSGADMLLVIGGAGSNCSIQPGQVEN